MRTVAQCLRRHYPFVEDQICNLRRYNSVIFTLFPFDRSEPEYQGLLVYAPYDHTHGWLRVIHSRISRKLFRNPRLFSKAIRDHNVKLLHVHMGFSGVPFLPIAQKARLPILTSFHGSDAYAFPDLPGYLDAYRELFTGGDTFTVVSQHMRRRLVELGCPEEKVVVHHVGVDVNRFTYLPRALKSGEKVRILCVANFAEHKGLPYLIEAVGRVRSRFPDIELRIVGSEVERVAHLVRQRIEALIKELNLSDEVTLVGRVEHAKIYKEYKWPHIFVLPSIVAADGRREGAPTVLMEAQASGLPVVSTYLTGIPEVVLDGESGYLVPVKDADSLTEKICRLIENHQRWPKMGKKGRAHICKEFNLITQVESLEDLYDKLIDERE